MAVYTHLSSDTLADLIRAYDVGTLISAKGIAEGVSNSNWLIVTSRGRYILTMYEHRIDIGQLPYFLSLLDHLAEKKCPVPSTIHDREGAQYLHLDGKAVALIEFLPGVSIDTPNEAQAEAVGRALAMIHLASRDFPLTRRNELCPAGWQTLFDQCDPAALDRINPDLRPALHRFMPETLQGWPRDLPMATIHADLFPDNVLMLSNNVSGLIDFYFACTDMAAYDVAITHAAWCFSADGQTFNPAISQALLSGYEAMRPLSDAERAGLPLLARGAALRFIATRTIDWLKTPSTALVARKDPMEFVNRLRFYAKSGQDAFTIGE